MQSRSSESCTKNGTAWNFLLKKPLLARRHLSIFIVPCASAKNNHDARRIPEDVIPQKEKAYSLAIFGALLILLAFASAFIYLATHSYVVIFGISAFDAVLFGVWAYLYRDKKVWLEG